MEPITIPGTTNYNTVHTPGQMSRNFFILIGLMLLLASLYPVLYHSAYKGNPDTHAAVEMIGSLLGLIAGFAMVMRFYTLGNRVHLFIGLAFFVNGAEDLVHGLLAFESNAGLIGMPASTLGQFVPGTYVTGRLMLGLILLAAPCAELVLKKSVNTKRETFWISSAAIIITVIFTVFAFKIPLPQFIYPERLVARPVDFLSAVVLFLALVAFLRLYRRSRDMLLWWISLSIGINVVGQLMMSFSRDLYDPFFDIAHLYKILGYSAPLLGFSLYQISVIAARKKAEEERQALEEQLRQSHKMEAIGSLAGGIAHDFNNILGAVMGFTELAMDDAPPGSPVEKNLKHVMKAAGRAKEMVRQILAFSREDEKERKPVLLDEIVHDAVKLLRVTLPSTIEIRPDIAGKANPVPANSTQLHQVIMNICTNAAHAMKEKGGILAISLKEIELDADTVSAKKLPPGRYQQLTFADNGHGMSPDVTRRIFDPYFTTKKQGEGTGMGLSVAHGIVKTHKGEITVYSEPGEGTTFHIFLPVMPDSAEAKEAESAVHFAEPVPGKGEWILFIDDEEELVQMEKQVLEKLGYQVVGITGSLQALALFQSGPFKFDLVITDQTMPEMTGLQLAREFREIRPDIPVILCTGFSESIGKENFRLKGIDAFLMKPVLKSDFAAVIREVLDGHQGAGAGCA